MSLAGVANPSRMDELLADRATQRLDAAEDRELATLLASRPDADLMTFDWVAAALHVPKILAEIEPMPPALRERVEIDAVAWLAASKGLTVVRNGKPARRQRSAVPATMGRLAWAPWLVAAACLVMAVLAWWPGSTAAPVETPSVVAQREAMLADPASTRIEWTDMEEAGVVGDVVWSDRSQSGFMRFRGLAVNDASEMQYQLWIFDAAREAYSADIAVDGGVFDVDRVSGDVIVPIRAKLEVFQPSLFAITTEPHGGVVKHADDADGRYRIILTAPVQS